MNARALKKAVRNRT